MDNIYESDGLTMSEPLKGVFEIFDYRPRKLADDASITGSFSRELPQNYKILNDEFTEGDALWLLLNIAEENSGRYRGRLWGTYPGGTFLDNRVGLEIGTENSAKLSDSSWIGLSAKGPGKYSIKLSKTWGKNHKLLLLRPEMDECRDSLESRLNYGLNAPHDMEALKYIEPILNERVPGWEENFKGELDDNKIENAWETIMHALKYSLYKDIEKIREVFSVGRYLVVDSVAGKAEYTEVKSFVVDGIEYLHRLMPVHSHNFYRMENIGDGQSFEYFGDRELIREYEDLLEKIGANSGQTMAGKINEAAGEFFSKKGEKIENVQSLQKGNAYAFKELFGSYNLARIIEGPVYSPGRKSGALLKLENIINISSNDDDSSLKFKEVRLDHDGLNETIIWLDEKGKIEDNLFGTIYAFPKDSAKQLSKISKLKNGYDLREKRLDKISDLDISWKIMENSPELSHLKRFI